MTPVHDAVEAAIVAAREDHESVIGLTRDLVRIPSRGGIDPYEPVIDRVRGWLTRHGLPATVLTDGSAVVGVTCEIAGSRPGPRWVLDACLDTAPFGDERAWTHPPTSAVVEDGWLWGRGAADSKCGAAIFCHVAARLAAIADRWRGSLVLLFDVDEHTGGFGGARRYFAAAGDVAGVLIGYPGLDKLVVGGRGVYRAAVRVHGVASHSGSSRRTPSAIAKAADLVRELSAVRLPEPDGFPLPGKLTVTAMHGGAGYSVTPDLCTLDVDIRTTPSFDADAAGRMVAELVARVDERWPGTRPTLVEVGTVWPAYALEADSPLRVALHDAARAVGVDVDAKIAGPSNIGNYLAGLGIPATAGFGVDHVGLHASNERIRLDTIPIVQAVYHAAVLALLSC